MKLGQLVMTCEISQVLENNSDFSRHVVSSLTRYQALDWGNCCEEDAALNDEAVKTGEDRILAVYKHPTREDWRIWIITEWDRSATTILFPHEY